MRLSRTLTLLAAALAFALVLAVGSLLLGRPVPLILEAGFDRPAISPNADGEDDIAVFDYRLSRPATVSLSLIAEGARGSISAKGRRAPTATTACSSAA